jgi:DNA-binding MarR family transcriptional regulator
MAVPSKPDIDAVADQLLHAFFQFRSVFRPDTFPHAQEHHFKDLRHSDVMLLFVLEKASRTSPEGVRVSDLGRMLQVKPPSITPILTRLERQSLIRRTIDPSDRRIIHVSLCEEGLKMVLQHKQMVMVWVKGLVGQLGVEKSVLFTELINETFHYVKENMNRNGPCGARRNG